MKSDVAILKTIVQYCDNILDNLRYYGNDEEVFYEDLRFQQSCAFCLLQVGEYVKRLSDSIKNDNPQIDWRDISGMRNIVVHDYKKIELPVVWTTITEEVPVLRDECVKILHKLE